MPGSEKELPILLFENQAEWENWLEANQEVSPGVRLKIAKKNTGALSLSYVEALESALCYGWIDSRKEKYDEKMWLQRFTPRGAGSIWSKVNKEKAERLIAAGRMKPGGMEAIERAKRNGLWDKAYESQSSREIPEDLAKALEDNGKAKAFFETLNSVNRYSIVFRIHNAKKPETRARKIREFIEMLEKGETIY